MNDTTNQPVFSIEKLYVKDMSIEVPNAPKIFLERDNPEVNVQIRSESSEVEDGIHEVVLTANVTAKLPDKRTLFMVEVSQCGIFQIRNLPAAELEPVLAIGCPNIIFPYAREAISDAVTRAGFQPVLLAPVNFEALYHAQLQQRNANAQDAGNDDTSAQPVQ